MMEGLRSWLLSVTGAALLLAGANALMPKGTVRAVGRLTGGLILFLAVVQPLTGWEGADPSDWLAELQAQATLEAAGLEETDGELLESLIAAESAAYIEAQGEVLGVSCQAEVTCRTDEDGLTVPVSVTVRGSWSEEQWQELSQIIAANLAIPAEEQRFTQEGAEE
jgi:stage III sporulation protein AF